MSSESSSPNEQPQETVQADSQIKLLLIGDSAVGKTCLMVRYTQDKFSPIFMSTVGIDFKYKLIDVNNKKVRLEIWDTAGQERFKAITRSYLRGAQGIILVYDVTEKSTFDHISVWMDQIQQYADISVGKIIVGNKCDLTDKRIITEEHGKELADKYNVPHFECSAKNGNNVNELFYAITEVVLNQVKPKEPTTGTVEPKPEKSSGGSGCC